MLILAVSSKTTFFLRTNRLLFFSLQIEAGPGTGYVEDTFPPVLKLLHVYILPTDDVYQAVAQQWPSLLTPLVRFSGAMLRLVRKSRSCNDGVTDRRNV
jgi:hypothetical protein